MRVLYQTYGLTNCPSCEASMLITYAFPFGTTHRQIDFWKTSKVETLKDKATSITAGCFNCGYKEELK